MGVKIVVPDVFKEETGKDVGGTTFESETVEPDEAGVTIVTGVETPEDMSDTTTILWDRGDG